MEWGGVTIRFGTVRRALCTLALVVVAMPDASATPDKVVGDGFTRDTANAALTAGDHVEAIRQFRTLAEQNENSAWAWFGLGNALYAKGERAQAASAFGLAASDRDLRAEARFREACARASIGQTEPALKSLAKALDAGFLDVNAMETDESLAVLRDSETYRELADQARQNRAKVPARQFDFWVGSWDLYDTRNELIGSVLVTLRRRGHLLHSEWKNRDGAAESECTSFYDPGRGRWRQLRIDDEGAVIEFVGGYHDSAMRLIGRETLASGASVLVRSTYSESPGAKLRHVTERSEDGGITWTPASDLKYVRREL